jgi:uncharacterized protein YhjY with autotransporter beta-barrel domain
MAQSAAFHACAEPSTARRARRHGLLCTTCLTPAVLAALLGLAPGAALAACVDVGAARTCTGNVTTGTFVSGPWPGLVPDIRSIAVNSLTASIVSTNGPAAGLLRFAVVGVGPNVSVNASIAAGLVAQGAPLNAAFLPRDVGTVHALSLGGRYSLGGAARVITEGDFNWFAERGAAIAASSLGGLSDDERVAGGLGGIATVTAGVGRVFTTQNEAVGISALSRGGRGDDGDRGSGLPSDGGIAGAGGTAAVSSAAFVRTLGRGAVGLLAQSRGGQGGDGGNSVVFGNGGDGGAGGAGGTATVVNSAFGRVVTLGLASHGVMALSVGGGGGAGGNFDGLVGLGGVGAQAGAGGAASAVNQGVIRTDASLAAGLVAMSVGGGGGDGGTSQGIIALGGDGTLASAGGTVTARNTRTIGTLGGFAQGIFALSQGGGGGRGANASGVIAVGSDAGGGGSGGAVTVEHSGTITTEGLNSEGILALSVGGGGGAGGSATAVAPLGPISVAIGGAGGAGGSGGTVRINHNAAALAAGANPGIVTRGDVATGLAGLSVGGGGGSAGSAVSVAVSSPFLPAVSVAIGGSGGDGGNGGLVESRHRGTIDTRGDVSHGIRLQSIGGGGGAGGGAVSVAAGVTAGISVGVGGSGGRGGSGGNVTYDGAATVSTLGASAIGVLLQSIGGGGGDGGRAISVGANVIGTLGVALGGTGGVGGAAGTVVGNSTGRIATLGDLSHGIMAQSIGGGGGNGGQAIGFGGGLAGAVNVAIGGGGGAGTFAGNVTVTQGAVAGEAPAILTRGVGAFGIAAQSVGGGGGHGGVSGAGAIGGGAALNVSLGGSGGIGAVGRTARVEGAGAIATRGDNAIGIVAQSIGGGGGLGAMAAGASAGLGAVDITIGGSGGIAGNGGVAVVAYDGDVSTGEVFEGGLVTGNSAAAILAQSIGGGGGVGGLATGATTSIGSVKVTLGGSGGTGGLGGAAEITYNGVARTVGNLAHGLLAQSIGGGGGIGGAARGGAGGGLGALVVTLGGDGAAGGSGSTARVDLRGSVFTEGDSAYGVVAQSIGGGGGVAGSALGVAISAAPLSIGVGGTGGLGGAGGAATVASRGTVETLGAHAFGIVAQSVGGGGGMAGESQVYAIGVPIGVPVGGKAGAGGGGGAASVENTGSVSTSGDFAIGILAQSVGAGGGTGAYGRFFGAQPPGVSGDYTLELSVTLGGRGGVAGLGGVVGVSGTGPVSTTGVLAPGILAQSVGGGGGIGGTATGQTAGLGNYGLNIAVGGGGGSAGAGGTVTLGYAGPVTTTGALSHGVHAQSIGGGGGTAGSASAGSATQYNLSFAVGGQGGSAGNGGFVGVTSAGTIATSGALAIGLVAQSIGGGGGTGGEASIDNSGFGTGTMTLGGDGGAGGAGGIVQVQRGFAGIVPPAASTPLPALAGYLLPAGVATLSTTGGGAPGIVAQSVGGGGGLGATNLNLALVTSFDLEGLSPTSHSWDVGANGTSGAGGFVTLAVADNIATGAAAPAADPAAPLLSMLRTARLSAEGGASPGIVAQSVGAGGGAYFGAGNTLLRATSGRAGVTAELGGIAGGSNPGGAVGLRFAGVIATQGLGSDAVIAQSVGGGGGVLVQAAGGLRRFGVGLDGAVLLGGRDVSDASGGSSAVTFQGVASTTGHAARAIVAQSIGGGGGLATLPFATGIGGPVTSDDDVRVGLGGAARVGTAANDSPAGAVSVRTVEATGEATILTTAGLGAHGIVAQSVGNGGGLAEVPVLMTTGDNVSRREYRFRAALGGSLGTAFSTGSALVNNQADIVTLGGHAIGIAAQSIGAGGGLAGMPVAFFLRAEDVRDRTVFIDQALGAATAAGNGGAVTVSNIGVIETAGFNAHGMLAQSIGGGGGAVVGALEFPIGTAAGDTPGVFAPRHRIETSIRLGGTAATGDGGTATVTNLAPVITRGDAALALVAQSIGGGGGLAGLGRPGSSWLYAAPGNDIGLSVSSDPADRAKLDVRQTVDLGAIGGSAGGGGAVTVVNRAAIGTAGSDAIALLAQSVGAGGGVAGLGMADPSGRIRLGAVSARTGSGGAVTVSFNQWSSIATGGRLAHGVVAQSIGGGGGVAGGGLGTVTLGAAGVSNSMTTFFSGGAVALTLDGPVAAGGALAAGVIAQSIGGGGGIAAADTLGGAETGLRSARLGASLDARGIGGAVSVTQRATGTLQTSGLLGMGLLAQSVGGGGGLTLLHSPGGSAADAALRPRYRLGAIMGSAGSGGAVTVTQEGLIATVGEAAHGMVAQSIGAGGGLAMGTGLYALGGNGAGGGAGGDVALTMRGGRVFTEGRSAHGVVAQSIGGGGGLAHALLAPGQEAGVIAAFPTIILGGSNTAVGHGGAASLVIEDRGRAGAGIGTTGAGAIGALVQSVGGGGGVSGGVVAAQGQLTLGAAGPSGDGGTVSLSVASRVATTGAAAPAAIAQSIGAGGGFATESTGAVTLGANQPTNSAGGNLRLLLAATGTVTATGQHAPAVIAQSVAAGGGFVGAAGGAVRLGSQGGSGAAGGAVEIRNNATLSAAGDYAAALLAQSVSGGGGIVQRTGGSATLGLSAVNLPGTSDFGNGGAGGSVTVCASPTTGAGGTPCSIAVGSTPGTVTPGALTAGGDGGIALVAQSVAGGGGFLGDVAGGATFGSVAPGSGGVVTVRGPGALTVRGADAAAAIAQSVGGGGGIVARAGGAAVLGGTAGGLAIAPAGAHGGTVTLETSAAVTASGERSLGLVAQSIGGGGGTVLSGGAGATLGGARVGDGGAARVVVGDATTSGAALIAQSVGGGGGLVGRAGGTVTMGGTASGAGRAATAEIRGAVATLGDGAPAVVVQSVGGGGGIVLGGAGSATLGGSGPGSGGEASVQVSSEASIATAGIGSAGIVAQSVGGGGGLVAGVNVGRVIFGGTGTAASNGGSVQVDSKAAITTLGEGAHGIVAQSGGGGGGIALGTRAPGANSPVRGGVGSGGSVGVVNGGAIQVSGANAHGIVAHSAGGGVVFANEGLRLGGEPGSGRIGRGGGTGAAGPISILNLGRVEAGGANGIGILAHSFADGFQAGATVRIELEPTSEVIGGPGGAAIVAQSRATPITLVNRGLVRANEGVAGRAVFVGGASGPLGLRNEGVITGSITAPSATIDNMSRGMINAGPSLALGGAGGLLNNGGGFAVAGRGTIGTTELNGRFVQSASGALYVDVAGRPGGGISVDRLDVLRTATLGGSVRPELIAGTTIAPGTHQATFLTASQGMTVSAPVLVPPPTLNMTWSLQYPTTKEAAIQVNVTTLAPSAAMTTNQRSVAGGLQRAALANPAGFAPLAPGVYGATDAVAYASAMTSLGGDGGMTGLVATQGAMRQFMAGLTARMDLLQRSFQSDVTPPASFLPYDVSAAFAGSGAIRGDGALLGMDSLADTLPSPFRVWAMPIGFGSGMDARAGFGTEAESRVGGFMTGFDTEITPRLTIGAVGGWSDGGYSAGSVVANGTLRGAHAGTYALWHDGPLYVSGMFGYARHDAQQSRVIAAPGVVEFARDDLAFHNVGANLEMGYRFRLGEEFTLTPLAGIGLNAWHREGSSEASRTATGAGGMLGLNQAAAGDYSVPISLGFRADTAWDVGRGLMLNAHARLAWVREEGASASSAASLAFAPGERFVLQGPAMPRDRLSFNLGVQLQPNERLGFGFGVLGDVGDGYSAIGGVGRVVWRW